MEGIRRNKEVAALVKMNNEKCNTGRVHVFGSILNDLPT